ncbi:sensor histidine kinase [Agrobacterium rosae]|uniref:histidine kinase n=1 Tax=Agrobacterium rosae TaxID=1972867 RepID=A0AAW9FJ85_9HYPH|nr:sensor histidine kinase [Agrobacterium rosae]MDX8305766.1 sensor histidine kinase [Agrobacterium rosae]
MLKEVNHRVQNSLQLVSAFLRLQARSANDSQSKLHLDEAQKRLTAVALVHRRLYQDESIEVIDLSRYLEDLCHEMKSSMDADWAEHIEVNLAPILVATERAVNIGLILTELIINANKYAYGGKPGPLAIDLEQHRTSLRLIVSDRGIGKSAGSSAGHGFGSRMLSAIVDRLGGHVDEEDNRPGLRTIVTAPI